MTDNRSTLRQPHDRAHRSSSRVDVVRQRLLPRHPHEHAQRRHQRRLARPVGLSAERRPSGRRSPRPATPASRRAARTRRNTPFPFWRCIGNVLLNDEPAEKCNGLINRTRTDAAQRRRVGTAHAARPVRRAGATSSRSAPPTTAAASTSRSRPSSATSIPIAASPASNAFGDGVTGGDVDGEPFDTRVDLDGLDPHLERLRHRHAVARRRLAPHAVRPLQPDVDRESRPHPARRRRRARSTAITTFGRFNPAAGVTFSPSPARQRLRRLQRGQPRADVDRARAAPIPSSPASCRTRWPAIRRSNRSSRGRGKAACAARTAA